MQELQGIITPKNANTFEQKSAKNQSYKCVIFHAISARKGKQKSAKKLWQKCAKTQARSLSCHKCKLKF